MWTVNSWVHTRLIYLHIFGGPYALTLRHTKIWHNIAYTLYTPYFYDRNHKSGIHVNYTVTEQ